jgi:hypothetical protein
MNMSALSTTEWILIIAAVLIVVGALAAVLYTRKRRTAKLRGKFGDPEYARAVQEGGNQRRAEAKLEERAERVESFHIRALSSSDHARFVDSWSKVQSRFVDSPGGAVAEADRLLGDVMLIRGYPVSDFEQRAADMSVDHPLVVENYRVAHAIAVRQTLGRASTEELRQAMIHYRTLFEELAGEPEKAMARSTT